MSQLEHLDLRLLGRRNVKISIGDYPKFSGKAKDWISFERKFRSTASSHGFDHVLQDEDFEPTDEIDWRQFHEDSAFIYDAFQNAWADSMNFYLVEQNKKEENGRKVYMDAKNYFRGEAVKDAILTENVDELVNTKLTYSTPNGAEGFNNKFNDIVNSLEQQGHVLDPKILRASPPHPVKRPHMGYAEIPGATAPHIRPIPYGVG